jgi:hypothetical protein
MVDSAAPVILDFQLPRSRPDAGELARSPGRRLHRVCIRSDARDYDSAIMNTARKTEANLLWRTCFARILRGGRPLQHHEYVGWGVLTAYSLFLIGWAYLHGVRNATANIPAAELQHASRLAGWLGALALDVARAFALFAGAGFLAALVLPSGSGRLGRGPIHLSALASTGALAVLAGMVQGIGSGRPVATTDLLSPLLGCLFGTWTGTLWGRGRQSRLWLVPKVTLLTFLVVLGAGAVVRQSLAPAPLPFEAARVTSADKRRLADLTHDTNPASRKENQTHTLRLTEHDVNVLLSWGLSLGPTGRKAVVRLDRDSVSLLLSLPVSLGADRTRYLNLQTTGGATITNGTLHVHMDRCRIGSLEVPSWILHSAGPFLAARLNCDPRTRLFLNAVREIVVEPNSLQLTYGYLDLPVRLRHSLFGPLHANEELLASTRTQMEGLRLLALSQQVVEASPSLALCLKAAFTLARDRSVRRDPVVENQAAIFALGVLVGHPQIQEFLGAVLLDPNEDAAPQMLQGVVVQGRSDWARHFCVSAAATLLSDEAVSDAAGQFKEELDGRAGGSGFSFADLLADRAGTTFARAATRNAAAARALQQRLAQDFRMEEIFPPAGDLPEGLSDAQMQSRYGGVGGTGYHALLEEIERRVAACAAYR